MLLLRQPCLRHNLKDSVLWGIAPLPLVAAWIPMRSISSYLARTVWLALLPLAASLCVAVIAVWVYSSDVALTSGLAAGGVIAVVWMTWISYGAARRLRRAASLLGSELEVTRDKVQTAWQAGGLLITELAAIRRSRLQQSRQEIQIYEQERCRLRSELHDLVQQDLAGLLTRLELLGSALSPQPPSSTALLSQARDLAQSAISQVEMTVQRIRPWSLDLLGLGPGVRELADHMQRQHGLQTEIEWIGDETTAKGLARPVVECIYRTIESVLFMAWMYRNAGFAHIVIDPTAEGQLVVQVSDDGNCCPPEGFDATYLCEVRRMAAHLSALGGKLLVEARNAPGMSTGTYTEVHIPIDA